MYIQDGSTGLTKKTNIYGFSNTLIDWKIKKKDRGQIQNGLNLLYLQSSCSITPQYIHLLQFLNANKWEEEVVCNSQNAF